MALAVQEDMSQQLSWSGSRQIVRSPRVVDSSFVPALVGIVEAGTKVADGCEMQMEQRVQRAVGPNVIIPNGQAGENLAPDQLRSPDVADKRLHGGVATDAAGKFKQPRIGFKMLFPKARGLQIPGEQFLVSNRRNDGVLLQRRDLRR